MPLRVQLQTLSLSTLPSRLSGARSLDSPELSCSARSLNPASSTAWPLSASPYSMQPYGWLSLRLRRRKPIAGFAYALTSALILAPLLWEATVRFKVLPPVATAAILVAYVLLDSILPIASLTAIGAALALMISTGDLVTFTTALLAIATIVEVIVCLGYRTKARPVAALSADFAIWILIYIATRSGGVPEGYLPIGMAASTTLCALLFVISAAAVAQRTVLRRQVIGIFDIIQLAVAFALAAGGELALTQARAAAPVGAFCAIAAALCYFIAFVRLAGAPGRNRNVFAAWAVALGLMACFLILPDSLLTWIWCAAALVATITGTRAFLPVLNVHGAVYLLAAGLISGGPVMLFETFTGSTLPPVPPALWIIGFSAACCYAACISAPRTPPWVRAIPALFTSTSIAALLMLVVLPLLNSAPSVGFLATARTLVISSIALTLALVGVRTAHKELVWLSYAAIALGAIKLFLEDFRQSPPAALAVSLLCYGALLILVPKLSAKKQGN
jgi:hypothetical protein